MIELKMQDNEKAEKIKSLLNDMKEYCKAGESLNVADFNNWKQKVLMVLDENERIRFNKLAFFQTTPDYSKINSDDLPF